MTRQAFLRTIWLARMVFFPVLAGLLVFWRYEAPSHYLWINLAAFLLGLVAIHLGRLPSKGGGRHTLGLVLIALLALPLVTGPHVEGVARWIALGPVQLNTGLLVLPLLAVLALRDERTGWLYLAAALPLAVLQPDAAAVMAVTGTLALFAIVHRRYWVLAIALAGLPATMFALQRGVLPPVPFVEGVVPMLWQEIGVPIHASAMALAPVVALLYFLMEQSIRRHDGLALASVLTGFYLASFIGPYPYPLAGYGAASILGFMIAIAATPRSGETERGVRAPPKPGPASPAD